MEEQQIQAKIIKQSVGGLGFLISVENAHGRPVISHIVKNGAAEQEGTLTVNDIIIDINGNPVRGDLEEVAKILLEPQVGSLVTINVLRRGKVTNGESDGEAHKTPQQDGAISQEALFDQPEASNAIPPVQSSSKTDASAKEESLVNSGKVGHEVALKIVNGEAKPSTPSPVKRMSNVRLKNVSTGSYLYDVLHAKAAKGHCTAKRCMASLLQPYGGEGAQKRPPGEARQKEEVKEQAIDFLEQYYTSMKRENSYAHKARVEHVMREIEKSGSYDLDEKELIFGARLAWRNAPKCIGRIHWKKLQIFDCRHVTSAREMYDCLIQHMKYGTNKGNLRSAMTIFPPRRPGIADFRVWNTQLVRYAGYEQPDGSIIGDPINVELTKIAQRLGWKGAGTMFDVLPWILQAKGEPPELFNVPEQHVLQVDINHPSYPAFNELGLRWYVIPAVSELLLDCGGVEFPAIPFNGWYMATEITRNLLDIYRYNLSEPIGKKFGLDTSSNASLWKDRVMVELTYAILHSFNEKRCTIVDHHTTSDTFMKHLADETVTRGGCPADWVWIVPPMSGSLCPVFHQEMLNYVLKPSYEYQDPPWKHYSLDDVSVANTRKRMGFKHVAKIVKFSAKLMGQAMAKRHKVTILYASETGKAENFAKVLNTLFLKAFDSKVYCMEEYNFTDVLNEQCVLVVASTAGNGEAPTNGETFGEQMYEMIYPSRKGQHRDCGIHIRPLSSQHISLESSQDLANLRYACFGLGSRAYPYFCAFARSLDKMMEILGGERIYPFGEGDELGGQQESFFKWAIGVFSAACEEFCLTDINIDEATANFSQPTDWNPGMYRFVLADKSEKALPRTQALSKLHNKLIGSASMIDVKNLQDPSTKRVTNLVRLGATDLCYQPGDHLSIYPSNRQDIVNALLKKFPTGSPNPDDLIHVDKLRKDAVTNSDKWVRYDNLPTPTTLRDIFTSFVDICTPPSVQLLSIMAKYATDPKDSNRLLELAKGTETYEDWKHDAYPHIVEVLEEFPSVTVDPTLLAVYLPKLNPRSYSISSSLSLHPGEVHATVALVTYHTQGGTGPLHYGVCSSWLNDLQPGDEVPCLVRSAPSFRLPENIAAPVILIGPGTGIAPFRSFWQQRLYEIQEKTYESGQFGSLHIYFGCRNQMDDVYRTELQDAKTKGAITEIFTAYSRETDKKRYVQHLLLENRQSVCDGIARAGAHIYVCGDVTMASDVLRTLHSILQGQLAMTQEEAQKYVLEMRASGRYHEDIFGVTLKTAEVTKQIRTAGKRTNASNGSSSTTMLEE